MEPLELTGPLGIRHFHLAKVCDVHVGHEHNYDHDTIVIRGPLQVLLTDATGAVTGISQPYEAGAVIFIAARQRHTLKALADNVRYLCVFSHRDFDGRVSQEYVGNAEAYGHDRLLEPTPSVTIPLGQQAGMLKEITDRPGWEGTLAQKYPQY